MQVTRHSKYALFYTLFVNNTQMAQALSNKSLTAQVHYQSQARSCGTCSRQSGSGTDLSISIQFPLQISFHQFSIPSHPLLTLNHTHTHTKAKGTKGIAECRPIRTWTDKHCYSQDQDSPVHCQWPAPRLELQVPPSHYCVVLQTRLLSELRVPYATVLRVSCLRIQQAADFQTVMLVSPMAMHKTLSQYSTDHNEDAKTRMSTFIWS